MLAPSIKLKTEGLLKGQVLLLVLIMLSIRFTKGLASIPKAKSLAFGK